jgi:hypothetical protein
MFRPVAKGVTWSLDVLFVGVIGDVRPLLAVWMCVRTGRRFLACGPRSAFAEGSMNRFQRVRVLCCLAGRGEVGGGGYYSFIFTNL